MTEPFTLTANPDKIQADWNLIDQFIRSVNPKDGKSETPLEPQWKYSESETLNTLRKVIESTYEQHYVTDSVQCFDAWLACGGASDTCRNTAMKYLWRYGKKGGKNTDDLYKAMHYIVLMIHAEKQMEDGENFGNTDTDL